MRGRPETFQACENIKHAHINGKGSKPMLKIGKSIGLKDELCPKVGDGEIRRRFEVA
jgi:hypothetical protein